METPKLIEPGVKYYINATLQKCQNMKESFNYLIYNFYYLAILFVFVGGFLLFKYKGKLTPAEIKQKKIEEKQIIYTNLLKINKMKHQMDSEKMLTGLPLWNTNNYQNLNYNPNNANLPVNQNMNTGFNPSLPFEKTNLQQTNSPSSFSPFANNKTFR